MLLQMTIGSWILLVAVFILAGFAGIATMDWSPAGIERRKENAKNTAGIIILVCLIVGGIWALIESNT